MKKMSAADVGIKKGIFRQKTNLSNKRFKISCMND